MVNRGAEKFAWSSLCSEALHFILSSLSCSQTQASVQALQALSLSDLHINYLLLHQQAFAVPFPFLRSHVAPRRHFSRMCCRESTFNKFVSKFCLEWTSLNPKLSLAMSEAALHLPQQNCVEME